MQLGQGIFRLGVSVSGRPIALYIDAGNPMSERLFRIEGVDAKAPPESAFAIPAGCPQSMTIHGANPLLMPAMMGLTKAANSL